MDNLVSIYKSMEVASGVNIFVTQTVPSNKLSGNHQYSKCRNGSVPPTNNGWLVHILVFSSTKHMKQVCYLEIVCAPEKGRGSKISSH